MFVINQADARAPYYWSYRLPVCPQGGAIGVGGHLCDLPGRMAKGMKATWLLRIHTKVFKKGKRKHGRHHCRHMPKPVSAKIDIATPLNPTFASIERMKKRRQRKKDKSAAKVTQFPLNRGMRAALADNVGDRPSCIARKAWARPKGGLTPPKTV